MPCYSERMYQLLLFIRTAIGIFAAVLATALINQAALVPPVAAAWLVPLLAGFCGGLACLNSRSFPYFAGLTSAWSAF